MYGEIMAILHGDYAQIISLLTIMKSNLRSAPYLTSSILFYNISLFMKLWTQQCKEILFQTLWLNNLEPFTAMIGTKNNKEDTYFINNFKTITRANKQLQNYCIKQQTKSKIIPSPWNFSSCVTKTNRVLRHLSFCAFFIVVKLDWMPPQQHDNIGKSWSM